MRTGKSGSLALRPATHLMPLRPGKLISIKRTSGLRDGMDFNASSAVPYASRQQVLGFLSKSEISFSRVPGLSSTIETLIGMEGGINEGSGGRDGKWNFCSTRATATPSKRACHSETN